MRLSKPEYEHEDTDKTFIFVHLLISFIAATCPSTLFFSKE